MSDKKKVVVIASWYPSRVKPYLGTFVQRQTEAAAHYAHMCVLFVCRDSQMKKKIDVQSEDIKNVFTVNVYYNSSNAAQKGWRFLKAYYLGWKHILLHFGKPDIIHLNILWPAGVFAYILKKFLGLKYIITENWTGYLDSDPSYNRSNTLKKYITRTIARNAEVITPVSLDLEKAMYSHGLKSKFEVVYNVVDMNVFYPSLIKKEGKMRFLHISTTLDEQKNVSGILTAVKMLSEKRTDFELKIVSEADFSDHEITADTLGILNKYVFFESAKQALDIAVEMRNAHCFVLFSNYENLPVVILEAMASGLPVVSSSVGGVPEHITKEFGILVEPHDINALHTAMENMIADHKKYDSNKIRNYALDNFSYEAVGKKFESIYKKIV